MAKCPDCGSNSFFHWRGTVDCVTNQMSEAQRKQQEELARTGLKKMKKIAPFIGVAVFLIWLVGFHEAFWPLVAFGLGYSAGTESESSKKYNHARGFYDGWIARTQGGGISAEIFNVKGVFLRPEIQYVLSAAERELLKDPDERSWRNLPPLEDGK